MNSIVIYGMSSTCPLVHPGWSSILYVTPFLSHEFVRLVSATRPHTQRVERVVGIGFQPGLEPAKVTAPARVP